MLPMLNCIAWFHIQALRGACPEEEVGSFMGRSDTARRGRDMREGAAAPEFVTSSTVAPFDLSLLFDNHCALKTEG